MSGARKATIGSPMVGVWGDAGALVPLNITGLPSELSFRSTAATGPIDAPVTLKVRSMSASEFMSHALFICVVAKSSELPSGDGDVTVTRGGVLIWYEAAE